MYNFSVADIIKVLHKKEYAIFTNDISPFNLNIVGIRATHPKVNAFNDVLNVFWYYKGHLNVVKMDCTTLAGLYYLEKPCNPKGCAILKAGQYRSTYVTVANFSQQAQFSTGYIKGITGVSQLVLGGTTEGSADAHVSFVNAIGKIGVAVRDDGASFNNSVNIDASAILDLTSTTRGFLPPRMTSVEMNAISSPATGLMIYDTTTNQWMGYDGTSWVIIG